MALVTGASVFDITSDIGINYVLDDYVVLDYINQGTPAVDLDFGAVVVITSATISATPNFIAVSSSTLPITATISATAFEFDQAASTLSSSVTMSAAAVKTAVGVVDASISSAITVAGTDLDFGASLLIASGTVTAAPVKTAVSGANLVVSSSIRATVFVEGTATLAISATASTTAVKTAVSTTTAAITSQVTADGSRLTFGSATLTITGGTVVVGTDIDVDPFNTYRVLEETRVNTITRETRTLVIPQETRAYKIKRPVFAGSGTRRNS